MTRSNWLDSKSVTGWLKTSTSYHFLRNSFGRCTMTILMTTNSTMPRLGSLRRKRWWKLWRITQYFWKTIAKWILQLSNCFQSCGKIWKNCREMKTDWWNRLMDSTLSWCKSDRSTLNKSGLNNDNKSMICKIKPRQYLPASISIGSHLFNQGRAVIPQFSVWAILPRFQGKENLSIFLIRPLICWPSDKQSILKT